MQSDNSGLPDAQVKDRLQQVWANWRKLTFCRTNRLLPHHGAVTGG
jgi:hypothetical protein